MQQALQEAWRFSTKRLFHLTDFEGVPSESVLEVFRYLQALGCLKIRVEVHRGKKIEWGSEGEEQVPSWMLDKVRRSEETGDQKWWLDHKGVLQSDPSVHRRLADVPKDTVIQGDCLEVLETFPDESVDASIGDPPAAIAFMGEKWDTFHGREAFCAFMTAVYKQVYRVLKPGGYALVWALPRTAHWTAWALEDAGFEVRDDLLLFTDPNPQRQAFWDSLSAEQQEALIRLTTQDPALHAVFGSGFPKSHDLSKAIDKKKGAKRKKVGAKKGVRGQDLNAIVRGEGVKDVGAEGGGIGAYGVGAKQVQAMIDVTEPATEEAKTWNGWGSALKPATEHWFLVRKPFKGSLVANVLEHGVGALNIDACRVQAPEGDRTDYHSADMVSAARIDPHAYGEHNAPRGQYTRPKEGRWPSHVMLMHSPGCKRVGEVTEPGVVINRFVDGAKPFGDGAGHDYTTEQAPETTRPVYECEPMCPVRLMDEQAGGDHKSTLTGRAAPDRRHKNRGSNGGASTFGGGDSAVYADTGGVSRFFQTFEADPKLPWFYYTKITTKERNQDLEGLPEKTVQEANPFFDGNARCITCGLPKMTVGPTCQCDHPVWQPTEGTKAKNYHPTVKPLSLCRYFVRLVTPKGGHVLDPFCGSGSTLVAAVEEGCTATGIEREVDYVQLAQTRQRNAIERCRPRQRQVASVEVMLDMGHETSPWENP